MKYLFAVFAVFFLAPIPLLLMLECKNYKGWCIEVAAAKEKIMSRPSLAGNPFRQLAEQLALERKGGDNRWRVDTAGLLALLIK